MMRRVAVLVMAVMALTAAGAPAGAVPQVLQYQGRLTDPAGQPITDPVSVTFSLYDDAAAAEPLWSQTFESLALDHGRFSVLLGGEDAPFTPELAEAIAEGADLFLGIQVGDDPEMTPRQQIAPVVYAHHATFADTAETVRSLDELGGMPGIAFQVVHRVTVAPGEALTVVSVTITTPDSGLILVTGSGTLVLDNTGGTGSLCQANIGEQVDTAPEAEMGLVIASVDAADSPVSHYVPFHSQRVYVKPAGTYAFHLNVRNISGTGTAAANRPSVTALFLRNDYGAGGGEEAAPRGAR